jgi:hypothetical protein
MGWVMFMMGPLQQDVKVEGWLVSMLKRPLEREEDEVLAMQGAFV